jgi:hypothetical protein
MINIQKHFDLLGKRVTEKVTNFEGIVTSICFDLYGCIQVLVHPGTDKDNKLLEQLWFDVSRINVLDDTPVMERPNYNFGIQAEGKQGAAEKPAIFTKV